MSASKYKKKIINQFNEIKKQKTKLKTIKDINLDLIHFEQEYDHKFKNQHKNIKAQTITKHKLKFQNTNNTRTQTQKIKPKNTNSKLNPSFKLNPRTSVISLLPRKSITFFSHCSFFFFLYSFLDSLSFDFLAVDWRGCGSMVGLVIWVQWVKILASGLGFWSMGCDMGFDGGGWSIQVVVGLVVFGLRSGFRCVGLVFWWL